MSRTKDGRSESVKRSFDRREVVKNGVRILREECAQALLEVQVLRSQNTVLFLLTMSTITPVLNIIQTHLGVNVVRLQKLMERDVIKTYIVFGSITYVFGNSMDLVHFQFYTTSSLT